MDVFDFEVRVKRGILKNVKSPSLAFVKEPPGKLLHRFMASERVPVITTEVEFEDSFSIESTSAGSPSPCPAQDPSIDPTGAPLDQAAAAAAQAKAARAPQQFPSDPIQKERMREKLAKVCAT